MTIDVHTHVVPTGLPFGSGGASRWPYVRVEGETADVVVNGRMFRRVRSNAWDLDRRIEDMEERGVDQQVLSPMPLLLSYWAPPREAAQYATWMNDWIAEAVREHPGRFEGLGMVPLQSPETAASMLTDIRNAGLRGVEVGTNVHGVGIADPRFRIVFEEAQRLGLSVFVHALQPPLSLRTNTGEAHAAVSFPLDVALATSTLMTSGTLSACPDLRVCMSHGGGAVAMSIHRLIRAWDQNPQIREQIAESPRDILRRLYFDQLVFDPDALRLLLAVVGTDRVVVGSDYPFMELETASPLPALGLGAETEERIRVTNALAFLGIAASSLTASR